MSLSKLESLPNEVLIDTLDKYINGVDLFAAFVDQLNSRFNALIAQCQQLQFDFIRCRKDDFRLCMALFPSFVDKIGGLALSERDTPGQIHAFLSFFPSFAEFKRLRSLHLHYNTEAADSDRVERALLSLFDTQIESVSIKALNTAKETSLYRVVLGLFYLPTLKRLSLGFELDNPCWERLKSGSSNVEHLTISSLHCEWKDLQFIFRCCSHLKYLNIRLPVPSSYRSFHYWPSVTTKVDTVPMNTLRTLILYFEEGDSTSFDILAQNLRAMPNLSRLELNAHNELINAGAWEYLIQTSLPLLTRFRLETNSSCLQERDLDSVIESFRSPFWMRKKNFRIIITKNEHVPLDNVIMDHVRGRRRRQSDLNSTRMAYSPTVRWWIAPHRSTNNNMHIMETITSLRLSGESSLPSGQHYLTNVKYLAVDYLDKTLLEWLTRNVNCSRITELAISFSNKEPQRITSLLTRTTNLNSLEINFDQLIIQQATRLGRNNRLKYLDVSDEPHTFSEENLQVMARLFPHIEHLVINTLDLNNVPILKAYLPSLRSLTLKIVDSQLNLSTNYEQKMWDHRLRKQTSFLFHRESTWITIWIDKATFGESFWRTFIKEPPGLIQALTTSKERFKRKFPFFK